MAPSNPKDKGKARAPSPTPPSPLPNNLSNSESSPLLRPASPSPSNSTPSRKPSGVALRHGRGPLIRDSDDEGSLPSQDGNDDIFANDDINGQITPGTLERGARRGRAASTHSSGYSYIPNLGTVCCTFFIFTFFTLLFLVAIVHLWAGHLLEEIGKSGGSPEEMARRGVIWEGPSAVRVHEGGDDKTVLLELEGKAGVDVRKALGWEEKDEQRAKWWDRWEGAVVRWAVDKVQDVQLAVGEVAVVDPQAQEYDGERHGQLLSASLKSPIRIPLSYPASKSRRRDDKREGRHLVDQSSDSQHDDDEKDSYSPVLSPVTLSIPITFPNPADLAEFAREAWSTKAYRVRVAVREVEVQAAEDVKGLLGRLVGRFGAIKVQEVKKIMQGLIPDLPGGTSDPSSLVHLKSYSVFPSTTRENKSFIAFAGHAELDNPLRHSTIIPKGLTWGLPFALPVSIYLPKGDKEDPPSLPPSSGIDFTEVGTEGNDGVLVAKVYASPFSFFGGAKSALLDVAGSLVHSGTSSSDDLGAALSKFVSTYLSGKNNTILIRYDANPSPDDLPAVIPLPPPVVGEVAEKIQVALSFPGNEAKLDLFKNLRIEDMKIKINGLLAGWLSSAKKKEDPDGDLLCSGKVVGDIDLPAAFAKVGDAVDVTGIWPDVYVYDGELPASADAEAQWLEKGIAASDINTPQLSFAFAPSRFDGKDYPPTPLPANAFARLRPSALIPAITTHTPANATHNATTTVSAVFIDAPLFLLPERADVFRRFVGKIIFGGPGAKVRASVRGISEAQVGIGGWGEVELQRLPIEGSFEVGRGGVESVQEN
ncbi:hypothetical protein T439DRAFT_330126 [Meredithblackwellia eburnea MCA 4105]